MPGNQKAPILLKKARDDQQLLVDMVSGVLGTDEQVGFHSQQAVEKAIKAVLEARGVSYRPDALRSRLALPRPAHGCDGGGYV